jgi:hypothetical protein
MIQKFKYLITLIALLVTQLQAVIIGNMYVEPRTVHSTVSTYTFEVRLIVPILNSGYLELEFSDMPAPFTSAA